MFSFQLHTRLTPSMALSPICRCCHPYKHLQLLMPKFPIQVMTLIEAANGILKQQQCQGLMTSPGGQSWWTWKLSLQVPRHTLSDVSSQLELLQR